MIPEQRDFLLRCRFSFGLKSFCFQRPGFRPPLETRRNRKFRTASPSVGLPVLRPEKITFRLLLFCLIMYLRSRFSLLILVLAGACHPAETTPAQGGAGKARQQAANARPAYQQVAEARLGKEVRYTLNKAGTLVLGQRVQQGTRPAHLNTVHLVVIRLKDNAILYEDHIANGRVEWFNDTQLRIDTYPGMVQGDANQQQTWYLYDLETKQKSLSPPEKL
jgi:hypothetical protein